MKLCFGLARVVLALPSFGIVLKFPRVHWLRAFYQIKKDFKAGIFWKCIVFSSESSHSVRYWLCRGFFENWKEFLFWRETPSDFLQPTYFSLFGLVNIQKFGKVCSESEYDFWIQLQQITNSGCSQDGHIFASPENFVSVGNKIRLVDYGSTNTREVIKLYGQKLWQEFDLEKSRKIEIS